MAALGGGGPRAWSVGALLLAVSDALQARLGAVAVRGELSGFTRAASGHCYFTLKDSEGNAAALRCAMFRRAAGLLDFSPADGQQVELRGRITVYEPRGELQCVVESLQRLGAGSLYELFLKLKGRLEAAGLFDAARKRPLPPYPRTLGVVTSLGAAALHDVLTAIARRAPQLRVIVYPSLVQGPEAPAQLARAIALAGQRAEVDALIVCRGGGSLEDLWAFNDEAVVRAIAASPLPVVCGVGHETDTTLAELAADLRAPTPTAAAELATPVRADELQRLQALQQRLQRAAHRRLDTQAQRLDRLALQMGRPARLLARQGARLDALAQRRGAALALGLERARRTLAQLSPRLAQATQAQQHRHGEQLARLALRLAAVDPHQVLSRGYAWLTDGAGRPVTLAAGLTPGVQLAAQWADGRAEVAVLGVTLGPADAGAAAAGPAAGPAVGPAASPDDGSSGRAARPGRRKR
ncbi:exodeoxyribonuclease VII large subunit [Aquabacterium sp. OR-4]|nr:exodeoxyribonuclease VII large subunit [Aquabacterium sp. OR-4]MDT7835319.1 exodeoxyribonuclease VII large subunit [Aquabacterium sp. OR-4]